jgi:hypothetical protein
VDSREHVILCDCVQGGGSAMCVWVVGECALYANGDVVFTEPLSGGTPSAFSVDGETFDMSDAQYQALGAVCAAGAGDSGVR